MNINIGMNLIKAIFLLDYLVFLTGCLPEKTLDTTTEATLRSSSGEMMASLPPDEQKLVAEAIKYYESGGIGLIAKQMAEAFGQTSDIPVSSIHELNGMTAAQIIEKMEAEKAAMKVREERAEAKAEQERKINELISRARQLRSDKQYESALSAYSEILAIDPNAEVATSGIKATEGEIAESEKVQAYLSKVKLSDFKAQRIDTYGKSDVPAVTWKMKNVGDQVLRKVKVVVYFRDSGDQVIYEEEYFPVLVTDYSFDSKPLKPGYVWEMGSGKYYTLDSNLSDWEEGNASIVVTDLAFAE